MGLVADLPTQAYDTTGAFGHGAAYSATHWGCPGGGDPIYILALYQGSGGAVASLLSVSPSGAKIQVQLEPQNKLANTIHEICQAFGLTKEDLTRVCHIQSRKTLYNWIDGRTKPRKEAMARMFDLLVVARAWRDAGFAADRGRIYEPVLRGQSVYDLLNEPEINKEHILFAGSRLGLLAAPKDSLTDPFA